MKLNDIETNEFIIRTFQVQTLTQYEKIKYAKLF